MPRDEDLATLQWFDNTSGVVADDIGGFYFSSEIQSRVYYVSSDGHLSIVAGRAWGFDGDGGPAVMAKLAAPGPLALDSAGNLYVADRGNLRIRKIDRQGIITTVAGKGTLGFSGDGGPATEAQFNILAMAVSCYVPGCSRGLGIAFDAEDNLYVADTRNERIRKVDKNGIITTLAGDGRRGPTGDGLPAVAGKFAGPLDVAVDRSGNVYVADTGNRSVRKIDKAGLLTTFAGTPCPPGSICDPAGDGGPAVSAHVNIPVAVAVDAESNLYLFDASYGTVRKVDKSGIISKVAGGGTCCSPEGGDGGPALNASLGATIDLALNSAGHVFIAAGRIRVIDSQGAINTVAGRRAESFGGDGMPANLQFPGFPWAVTVDPEGNIFVGPGGLKKIDRFGRMTTFANVSAYGMASDKDGNIYATTLSSVYKISRQGIVTRVVITGVDPGNAPPLDTTTGQPPNPFLYALSVAVDSSGNLYVADRTMGRVFRVDPSGSAHTFLEVPGVSAVALDRADNIYILAGRVYRQDPQGLTVVAGGGTDYPGDGGPATSAQLTAPRSIAVDNSGNIYISESNHRIRKVDSRGTISTIAGNSIPGFSGDGLDPQLSQLSFPYGIAVDTRGDLYIADTINNRVRKVIFHAAATRRRP